MSFRKLDILNSGFKTEVDLEYYERFKNQSIYLFKARTGLFYARVVNEGKVVGIHRLIIGAKKGEIVDHIDGDGLNNKKENLRIVTFSQNRANTRKRKKDCSSRMKGVDVKDGKYRARIFLNGKSVHLGYFPLTPEGERMAGKAYDEKAREVFGFYAATNFMIS